MEQALRRLNKMKFRATQKDIDNIWITADTHFGHANIIKYCNRPFKDVKEMDAALIKNWNDTIPKNGIVFHLGDFSFGNPEPYLRQLNYGQPHLIFGNHDKAHFPLHVHTYDMVELQIEKISATLLHYPMVSWNKSHHGAYHFFGHVHNSMPENQIRPFSWNVGVDVNDYRPISLREAMYRATNHEGNKVLPPHTKGRVL
jgi:calcineurin-like phosphoesterase family protein